MTKWLDCHGFPHGKPRNDKNGKIVMPAFGGLAMINLLGSLREPLQKITSNMRDLITYFLPLKIFLNHKIKKGSEGNGGIEEDYGKIWQSI